MLLIGTTNLTRTKSTGDFYCPACGAIQDYRLRIRRPFLTLYFIPVIPIGPAEAFVQCSTCKTNSPLIALEQDEHSVRQAQAAQFRNEVFYAATLVVMSDGSISENEIDTLIDLGNKLLDDGIDREQLGAYCSSIRLNRITPHNYISTVARSWSSEQQRLALQAIFIAATADGQLQPPQLKLLKSLQEQFGMSESEYQSAIEEAIEVGFFVTPLA